MNLTPELVPKDVKQWYGIPELRLHWHCSYTIHHHGKLRMLKCRVDQRLPSKHKNDSLAGTTVLLVDDNFMLGYDKLLKLEKTG